MKTQLWKFPEFREKYQPILGDKLFFKLKSFLMDEIIGINQDLMHEISIAHGWSRHYKGSKNKVVFMEDFLDRHLGYVTKINDEIISLTTDNVYPYFENSALCIIHLLKEKNDANKNYVLSEKFERSFSPPLNENALNELRKFIVDEIIDKTQIECSKWEKYTVEARSRLEDEVHKMVEKWD